MNQHDDVIVGQVVDSDQEDGVTAQELLAMMAGDPAVAIATAADVLTAVAECSDSNPEIIQGIVNELDSRASQFVAVLADAVYRQRAYRGMTPFLSWIANSPYVVPESLADALLRWGQNEWYGLTPPETYSEYRDTVATLVQMKYIDAIEEDLDELDALWTLYLAAGSGVVGNGVMGTTTHEWQYSAEIRWADGQVETVPASRCGNTRWQIEEWATIGHRTPACQKVVRRRLSVHGPWVDMA